MLTHAQRQVLDLISDRLALEGVPPSYAEITTAMGWKSKAQVHAVIGRLEERGFIHRLPGKARSLRVIDQGNGAMSQRELHRLALELIRTARVERETEERTTLEVNRDLWEALTREVADHDIRQKG